MRLIAHRLSLLLPTRRLQSPRLPTQHTRRYSLQHDTASVAEIAGGSRHDSNVSVNGYVRTVRSMKKHSFVEIGDGSTMKTLQAVMTPEAAKGLGVGAAVRLKGTVVSSPKQAIGCELQTQQVELRGPSDPQTFPIQNKYHTPEYLRTIPHLRTRTTYNSALLRFRSDIVAALSGFFRSQDYIQCHTPIITSSDCEGAGEAFTALPSHKGEAPQKKFFREDKYLTVSSQLHLEALAQSVGNVWTLSPTFRAEQSDTSRHLSEFYMLEAEMGFADNLAQIMNLCEDMIRTVATNVTTLGNTASELREYAKRQTGTSSIDLDARWQGLQQPSWPRITYTEAISILSTTDEVSTRPKWGQDLSSEHEKCIARLVGEGRPVFVTHYPKAIKAFYMLATESVEDESRSTVDCFDLLVPDYCEIAGGSMREHRLEPLLAAMKSRGMAVPSSSQPDQTTKDDGPRGSLDWYIDLRRWGSAPHGGFGLGFDRLLAYMSGVESIRDMVTFPRWHGRCDC